MNTKTIALIIVFAALTVVFTQIKIPAPYFPFLMYQLWEIFIVAAFVLISPKASVAIAILNAFALLAISPGALLMGPFYNLFAVLSMLLGVYMAYRIINYMHAADENKSTTRYKTNLIMASTSLGIVFRVAVMSVVNYTVLRFPAPIGYSMPEIAILGSLPVIAFFNFTVALYTVPIAQVLSIAIKKNLRLN